MQCNFTKKKLEDRIKNNQLPENIYEEINVTAPEHESAMTYLKELHLTSLPVLMERGTENVLAIGFRPDVIDALS